MPWTPMAVSAWRTSSSLNGLMIATTSFMGASFHNVLGSLAAPACLPIQIWHLSVQMAQKSCRRKWNHLRLNAPLSVQAAGSSARMRPQAGTRHPGELRHRVKVNRGQQVGGAHVELVLCGQRPATGTL